MRKLMWFSIGFTASCVICAYLLNSSWLISLCLLVFLLAGAIFFIPSLRRKFFHYILIGCAIGLIWNWGYDRLYLSAAGSYHGRAEIISIEVTDYSTHSDYGVYAVGKVELDEKTYKIQFYLNQDTSLSPGDLVKGGFTLHDTASIDNGSYHRGNGIFILANPKGEIEVEFAERIPSRYLPAVMRHRILLMLKTVFPEDTCAFAQALLVGETSGLSYETDTALKTSGIRHVVAVSGLHVSILFALVYLLCGKQRFLTALFGLPVLLLFAAVAGFSPSIVRACVMQALMILALLLNKEYDPPTALSFAVLTILVVNPGAITSVSLQLSAGCMIGIFLFAEPIRRYLLHLNWLGEAKGKSLKAYLARWFASSVSVTLGAMITTTPLCAWYFGTVSLAGIVTNLLTLWVVSFVFYGLLAACGLGAIWLPLGTCLAWVVSWPIRYVLWVAKMISKVPVSAVYTSSVYIVIWLILCYVLLMVFRKRKKHPVLMAGCMTIGLAAALLLSWIEPRLDHYRISAVDVGQGQCLVIQNEGKYYMVDCGGDSDAYAADRATQFLLSQGVFRLDGVIVTHYDEDHAGGVANLMHRIPADTLYLPIVDSESDLQNQLKAEYSDKIKWVAQTEELQLEDGKITIIPSQNRQDANESSLCVLFQKKNCDILITGDRSEKGEQELMDTVELPDLEILVAGHHGSATSTSWELLRATQPEIVLISVGEGNRYGHPKQETLERLKLFDCLVYRTDLEGTLIFRG